MRTDNLVRRSAEFPMPCKSSTVFNFISVYGEREAGSTEWGSIVLSMLCHAYCVKITLQTSGEAIFST